MRALTLTNGRLQFVHDMPSPIRHADQALLRIRCAGICNTDLELVQGYLNFSGILGHEFVAEVIDGDPAWVGQRVVGEINIADGTCDMCQQGIPSQCHHRTTIGIRDHAGAFAEYLALAVRNLHRVPDSVADEQAVFTEPLAAALQILEAVQISPRHRVILLGAGKLGMLIAQVLKLTGADVIAVVRREKQARLLNGWGITSAAYEALPPRRADIVVDATGNADGFDKALNLVQPRGTIVLKSTYSGLPTIDMSRIAVDELRVVGSRCGSFAAALRLLAMGVIDTESLIEARRSLDEGVSAFAQAAQPGMLKVLLEV